MSCPKSGGDHGVTVLLNTGNQSSGDRGRCKSVQDSFLNSAIFVLDEYEAALVCPNLIEQQRLIFAHPFRASIPLSLS
jgi:hypothetical protein